MSRLSVVELYFRSSYITVVRDEITGTYLHTPIVPENHSSKGRLWRWRQQLPPEHWHTPARPRRLVSIFLALKPLKMRNYLHDWNCLCTKLSALLLFPVSDDCNAAQSPCSVHECPPGKQCYLQQVQCVAAPCLPVPACKDQDYDYNWCVTAVRCISHYVLVCTRAIRISGRSHVQILTLKPGIMIETFEYFSKYLRESAATIS